MRLTIHVPKRLPSRRWAIIHGNDGPRSVEDEDDDEYEDDYGTDG
jgi:hypothetical protein